MLFHFPVEGQGWMTLKSWWTPGAKENSLAIRRVSPRSLRNLAGIWEKRSGDATWRCVCLLGRMCFWGWEGFQTPTLSGHAPSSHSHQWRMLNMPGREDDHILCPWWNCHVRLETCDQCCLLVVSQTTEKCTVTGITIRSGEHKHRAARGQNTHTPACKPWCNPW